MLTPIGQKLESFFERELNELIGSESSEEIFGTSGSDLILGGLGSDTLWGGHGDDILGGYLLYEDSLSSKDVIIELTRFDRDVLYGGPGNDVYLIDGWMSNLPTIVELPDEGVDTIFGDVPTFSLPPNVENYVNDLSITNNGSPVYMVITGNDLDNLISTFSWSSNSAEHFIGGDGNDTLVGGGGNDILDGGIGVDTAVYQYNRDDYLISTSSNNTRMVSYVGPLIQIFPPPITEGTDRLIGIERLQFADTTIALDFMRGESAYNTVILIGAALGKHKIPEFFSIGLSFFDSGSSLRSMANLVCDLQLIEAQISDSSNEAWVTHVYRNVTGSSPDREVAGQYIELLNIGTFSRADLLTLSLSIANLEAQVDLVGYQSTGLALTPF